MQCARAKYCLWKSPRVLCPAKYSVYTANYIAKYTANYTVNYTAKYIARYTVQYIAKYTVYTAKYTVYTANYTVKQTDKFTVQYTAKCKSQQKMILVSDERRPSICSHLFPAGENRYE